MKTQLFNYLRFNRAERNGTLALFLLAAVFFAIPEVARHLRTPESTDFSLFQAEIQSFRMALGNGSRSSDGAKKNLFNFDPNTASYDDFIRLGLSEKVARTICNYREKGGKFKTPSDFQKIWSLKKEDYARLLPYLHFGSKSESPAGEKPSKPAPELFSFDPNSATEADLQRLGLPERTIKSILNYRDKGGKFRKKEDLEKIYTLSEEDYTRIAPHATFSEANILASSTNPGGNAGGFNRSGKKAAVQVLVDINQAGKEAWMSLPGIGEMRAQQLVDYREKLGGFLSVEQIGEMKNFPDSVFQAIRPNLMIGTKGIQKINLNAVSVADLDAHPYISKRQAELIVAFREQHGAFTSPEDLGRMRAFSDRVWLAKIGPYLSVN
jgi:DNA uptake protein ComE-like DNA-binding protein